MAARPNSLRTLEYGRNLASHHLDRLQEMMDMTERALQGNQLLSPTDIASYKLCLRAAKKQHTQFLKVLNIPLPEVDTSTTRRKRGRPSKAELAELNAARNGKAAPKRAQRKRKSIKVPVEAEATAPKRRGRPKGSKNKPKAEAAPAPKRRGRPKGSKNKPKAEAAPAPEATPAPKRRGRPKGSKNKPKAEAAAA